MSMFDGITKSIYFMENPEWYYYDETDPDNPYPLLTDKATPEAIESYNYWKAKYEKSLETGIIYD